MKPLFFRINQWPTNLRITVLVVLLVVLTVCWYFAVEKELLAKTSAKNSIKMQLVTGMMELQELSSLKRNYIYTTDLEESGLQDVLQSLATTTGGLVMSDFIDQGKKTMSGGGARFALAAENIQVDLVPQLSRHVVTLKFKGSFTNFLKYLQALQNDPRQIYFESVDFNMKVFPKADITLTVFTLGMQ